MDSTNEHKLEQKAYIKATNRDANASRPYLKYLEQREEDGRPLRLDQLWKEHYKFAVPSAILRYKGQAPAHTALLLYSHAEGRYRHSTSEREHPLTFKATVLG